MRFGLFLVAVMMFAPGSGESQTATNSQVANLLGRWRIDFTLSGTGAKKLIFNSQQQGLGSFMLLDTGPDNKPEPAPVPAVWITTTNERLSFVAEVEMPIGTCCRERGELIFKGKFVSGNSISGRVVFIGSSVDEENSNGFRSLSGTFTAVRDIK